MGDEYRAIGFIGDEIQVEFDKPPTLTKRPDSPQRFLWQGELHKIVYVRSRWTDFERRGNMARNMQEHHLRVARQRGSWGVGRFYFRVETSSGRVFDLYYDRAPESAQDRAGHWFLWRELELAET
jgi:hypothetical protein